MSTDLILFDLDGTLLNSAEIIIRTQELTAAEHGLVHPGREKGFSIIGLSLDIALADLFGDDVPAAALSATYKRIFGQLRGTPGMEEPLFDGISSTLAKVSGWSQTTLGIATGKTRKGVDYVIDLYGWHDMFATIQTADSAPSKPHPGMIQQAMALTGAQPSRTVMIGDSVHDMRMARAAGVAAIAVSWGFQPPAMLVEAGADLVAARADDLPGLIRQALSSPVRATG